MLAFTEDIKMECYAPALRCQELSLCCVIQVFTLRRSSPSTSSQNRRLWGGSPAPERRMSHSRNALSPTLRRSHLIDSQSPSASSRPMMNSASAVSERSRNCLSQKKGRRCGERLFPLLFPFADDRRIYKDTKFQADVHSTNRQPPAKSGAAYGADARTSSRRSALNAGSYLSGS